MKNVIILFVIFFSLSNCQKESNSFDDINIHNHQDNISPAPAPRIDICHFDNENMSWHLITINQNAWPAHENHGDVRLDDEDQDGYVPDNECGVEPMGDCNDNDVSVNPGEVEDCNNGVDDNCNGLVDEEEGICRDFCHPNEIEIDINTGSEEYKIYVYPFDNAGSIRWSPTVGFIGATAPWDGKANTATIIDAFRQGGFAASLCDRLSIQSGCEWYLPSLGELRSIYNELGPRGNGSIPNGLYWSSNESNANNALVFNFASGQGSPTGKIFNVKCRCVRR